LITPSFTMVLIAFFWFLSLYNFQAPMLLTVYTKKLT